jgi:hypothetical protein
MSYDSNTAEDTGRDPDREEEYAAETSRVWITDDDHEPVDQGDAEAFNDESVRQEYANLTHEDPEELEVYEDATEFFTEPIGNRNDTPHDNQEVDSETKAHVKYTLPTVHHIAASWNRHAHHVRWPAGAQPPISRILADGVNGSSVDPAFLETSKVASLGATCKKRWELLDTLCSLHFLARKINSTTIYWLHYYYATDVIVDKYLVQHMTANPSGVSHIGAKGE